MSEPPEVSYLTVHGHERAFVKLGEGPALLLLHGLGCNHDTWWPVLQQLARHHTVIAPDLLGHGASAKPRADYSVGGYANGMRDLLSLLDIETATVVGHSFGGGVAMQFAYQFPERTERLVLVAPGGLGPEVSPLIRALTLPGSLQVLGLATLPGVRHLGRLGMRLLHGTGRSAARDLLEVAAIYDSLRDPRARAAIRHVTRAVVDLRGQVVTMVDRAYLTEGMPTLVVWGEDDRVIPAAHAEHVALIAPDASVEVIADSGHFPHKDHPERFVAVVEAFIRDTRPATHAPERWRALMEKGHREPIDLDQPPAAVARLASAN